MHRSCEEKEGEAVERQGKRKGLTHWVTHWVLVFINVHHLCFTGPSPRSMCNPSPGTWWANFEHRGTCGVGCVWPSLQARHSWRSCKLWKLSAKRNTETFQLSPSKGFIQTQIPRRFTCFTDLTVQHWSCIFVGAFFRVEGSRPHALAWCSENKNFQDRLRKIRIGCQERIGE